VLNTSTFDYFSGKPMRFSKLNFFISHPTLQQTNGTDLELTDAFYIDFAESNKTLEGAEAGVSMTYELDPGSYDALELGLGVSNDLNDKQPSDFGNDHPLNQYGNYWTAWNSFIFSKTEGKYDSDGDGNFEVGFAYHLGSDKMFRTLNSTGNFDIESGKTTQVEITIDYQRVLGTSVEFLDIEAYPAFHSPQDPVLAALTEMLANNYSAAVEIKKQ